IVIDFFRTAALVLAKLHGLIERILASRRWPSLNILILALGTCLLLAFASTVLFFGRLINRQHLISSLLIFESGLCIGMLVAVEVVTNIRKRRQATRMNDVLRQALDGPGLHENVNSDKAPSAPSPLASGSDSEVKEVPDRFACVGKIPAIDSPLQSTYCTNTELVVSMSQFQTIPALNNNRLLPERTVPEGVDPRSTPCAEPNQRTPEDSESVITAGKEETSAKIF